MTSTVEELSLELRLLLSLTLNEFSCVPDGDQVPLAHPIHIGQPLLELLLRRAALPTFHVKHMILSCSAARSRRVG